MNLPPGWRLDDPDDPRALVWEEWRGPWLLRAVCPLWAPYEGPGEVTVILGDSEAEGTAGGVPVDVLRSYPLGEVKAQARSLLARVREDLTLAEVWGNPFSDLPRQCRSDADYAEWAVAWMLICEISKSPVKGLVERTGVRQSSVSTRIAKLRELGFIDTDNQITARCQAIWNARKAGPFD